MIKQTNFNVAGVILALLFVSGCNDDGPTPTPDPPSIRVSIIGQRNLVGDDKFELVYSFSAPGEAQEVSYGFVADGVGQDSGYAFLAEPELSGPTEGSGSVTGILHNFLYGGKDVTAYMEVVDKAGQKASDEVSFFVASAAASIFSTRILAAPTGENDSETFYSIRCDSLYSQADILAAADPISKTIDIAYYYGASDEATLVSPDDYPSNIVDLSAWGTRNTTNLELTVLTDEEYMTLRTTSQVEKAMDAITFDSDNTITNLAVGDILAFATTDNSEIGGFIKVVAINGTSNNGDGIEVEIITNFPELASK